MKKGGKMDGKSAIRGGGILMPNGKCHAKKSISLDPFSTRSINSHKFSVTRKARNKVFWR